MYGNIVILCSVIVVKRVLIYLLKECECLHTRAAGCILYEITSCILDALQHLYYEQCVCLQHHYHSTKMERDGGCRFYQEAPGALQVLGTLYVLWLHLTFIGWVVPFWGRCTIINVCTRGYYISMSRAWV